MFFFSCGPNPLETFFMSWSQRAKAFSVHSKEQYLSNIVHKSKMPHMCDAMDHLWKTGEQYLKGSGYLKYKENKKKTIEFSSWKIGAKTRKTSVPNPDRHQQRRSIHNKSEKTVKTLNYQDGRADLTQRQGCQVDPWNENTKNKQTNNKCVTQCRALYFITSAILQCVHFTDCTYVVFYIFSAVWFNFKLQFFKRQLQPKQSQCWSQTYSAINMFVILKVSLIRI